MKRVLIICLAVIAIALVLTAFTWESEPEDIIFDCDPWEWRDPPTICMGGGCDNPEYFDYPEDPSLGLPCWPKYWIQNGGTVDFMTTCQPGAYAGCWETIFGAYRECMTVDGQNMISKGYKFDVDGTGMAKISWNPFCKPVIRVDLRHDPETEWP